MQHLKEKLNAALEKFVSGNAGNPSELYEPINYSLGLGGKRLRPMLLLQACEVFGGNVEDAIAAALSIEVFHNFTLLHDDIMDKAPIRRNQPTVHEKWNNNIAILSGDTMFVKSFELLLQTNHSKALKIFKLFSKTAIEVCEGQQLDMNFETQPNVSIDDYLHMIELKTAVLLACALQMGSIIGNASADDCKNMYEFGRNIGIAFQLQDDILDVFGNQENFGKMVGGDIVSNKKTYLLLKSKELANLQQKAELERLLNYNGTNILEKVDGVKNIYEQLNIRNHAQNKMKDYYDVAVHHLDATSLNTENKNLLMNFADDLMVRNN